jgi:hypothetical protein
MKELCNLCFNLIFCEKDNSRLMSELEVAAKACPFCEAFYERMLEQCPKGSSDLTCQFEGRTFKDGFVQLNMTLVSEKDNQRTAVVDDPIPSPEIISHWRIAYLECRVRPWPNPSSNVAKSLRAGQSPNTSVEGRFHRVDWQPGVMDLATRFGVIDQWLKDCFQNHKSCHEVKMPGYPRRLLDITDVENTSLVDRVETGM